MRHLLRYLPVLGAVAAVTFLDFKVAPREIVVAHGGGIWVET
jgi:hypothetical protein